MGNPDRLPRRRPPNPPPEQPARARDSSRALPAHRCTGRLQPLAGLKPHPANPNTHPAEQLRLYQKIIHHQGWRRPIVVSNLSGYIIKGHGAYAAARAAGWSQVPVEHQDYASEADELTDLLADNQLARQSRPEEDTLAELLDELSASGRDPEHAGLLLKLKRIQDNVPSPPDDPDPLQLIATCDSESQRTILILQLTAQGETARAIAHRPRRKKSSRATR